ncbi:MAG: hypothetical protein K0S44_421 [Bacteroidetes bacterium]|nr:hypothetical protein [Bacteroidota bacterium]
MYSRIEASRLKHEFWISFGRYISLHNNSEGLRINWVNYHTGHKFLYFRMEATKNNASISIQITHPDGLSRQLFYDKFLSFRSIIHSTLHEEWSWKSEITDEHGKIISVIYTEVKKVNVYDKNTWPDIISFLKPRMIALDEVWNDIKDAFEDLR